MPAPVPLGQRLRRARRTCRRPDRAPSDAALRRARPRGAARPSITPSQQPRQRAQDDEDQDEPENQPQPSTYSGFRAASPPVWPADAPTAGRRAPRFAACAFRAVGRHVEHLLPRLLRRRRDPACRTPARCRRSAASSRASGSSASDLIELLERLVRLVRVVVATPRSVLDVDVLRVELQRLVVPLDRVVVALGVEVQVAELRRAASASRGFALGVVLSA